MAYNVRCFLHQVARPTAHAPSSSIRRLFRRHVDSARLPPPTMRIVRLFLFPFLLHFQHASTSPLTSSVWMHLHMRSDPNERAYFWLPSSEATSTHELLDSPEVERLYIDQGEIVRVRVERDEFCDDEPGPPKATEGVLIGGQVQARRLPYTVTVSPILSCEAQCLL